MTGWLGLLISIGVVVVCMIAFRSISHRMKKTQTLLKKDGEKLAKSVDEIHLKKTGEHSPTVILFYPHLSDEEQNREREAKRR